MLYIDNTHSNIELALQEHARFVRCYIWKKIGAKYESGKRKKCADHKCPICKTGKIKAYAAVPLYIYNYLNDDTLLEILISGTPEEIAELDKDFWNYVAPDIDLENRLKIANSNTDAVAPFNATITKLIKDYYKCINKVINYANWFDSAEPTSYYSAYHLATYLDRRTCVYCNRTYTLTQFKRNESGKIGKLLRPQFDHWYPQETFPLLSLSFYNLIPSCSICNSSVKGRTKFTLDDYVHPYVDNITSSTYFSYVYKGSMSTLELQLLAIDDDKMLEKRIANTIADFRLNEMYNAHAEELLDLLKIKQAYSETYLKTLRTAFPSMVLTDQEMYRLAFGVELEEIDFHKRPFSKFKYDILKELEVI